MSLFGQAKRYTPSKPSRRSPLPSFADEKRFGLSSPVASGSGLSRYITTFVVPLPDIPFARSPPSPSSEHLMNGNGIPHTSKVYASRPRRYIRLCLPLPPHLAARIPRISSKRRLLGAVLGLFLLIIFLMGFRKPPAGRTWTAPFTDPSTLVITPEEVAMIWEWEVLSGHYPSLHLGE